jgi:hypothetical protein
VKGKEMIAPLYASPLTSLLDSGSMARGPSALDASRNLVGGEINNASPEMRDRITQGALTPNREVNLKYHVKK